MFREAGGSRIVAASVFIELPIDRFARSSGDHGVSLGF
jgi:hypothetical protein